MRTPAEPAPGQAQIATLTMNPALDITTSVDLVRPTEKLRCQTTRYDPGGGGINVARVARVLGASVVAVFPAGGPTGDLLVSLLGDAGVPFRKVPIAASTRESLTVNETSSGQQYRFVLPGPRLTVREQAHCLEQLRAATESAEFVVASGSLPPGVTADFYQRVADICRHRGARLILDTSGGGLQHVSSGVFLLKASVRELRECVGRSLATEADQIAAAHQLVDSGRAHVVLVSLGSHGALLTTRRASQRFSAIPMAGGSGVGAGDAMVAAITVGLGRGWPLSKSVRLGIAAGAAMLMTPGTAACERADVERLFARSAEPCDVPRP
ncbi:1-phosphofructokinase family hexose kinase [Mycobacterium heidelbergense]|uniref:Phosphofructokinase n=1 Tax=Mycobacterium heidelbergense TaxID=53376 RepID=A0A1X0DR06_MYCHE|nr:1-phosphofructokinase family hexose kinase [Mycobacterium heidelbergense]MCV7053275.1 1-phosphofructokinase family hexose kinase [Mycobacterium heidelbergense]ORA74330.1 phosphofructokinase [Mycobacterium heidelbergense]BBZ49069.1 putative ATP-dependent 6-phosphofructokinase isozyme 2 [Mycobacterium heidelbergense]